jgi:hypothetical protein
VSTTRPLWGIGRLAGDGGDGPPYRVSGDDVRKDFKAAIAALQSLGVGAGDHVLFVSMLSEAAQVGPFELAASRLGARYSSADAQQFDAHRTATLVRRVRPQAVLGVNAAVLAGLDELEVDPAELFAAVPAVGARPDAIDRIPGATWWLPVGPAVAVGCAAGRAAGGHVDAGEWRIDTDREGQVRISNARPERATALDRWPTGVVASIATEPCACGRDDPRLVVAW